jgi:hypothetical protein
MNRPISPIEIGRLAREEGYVFNRLGQQAWRIQATDRDVAVRAGAKHMISKARLGTITVAEILIRRDAVSNLLLQLLRLRETPFLLTGKDRLPIESNFKNPAPARDQRHLSDAVLKSSQQLLSHPRRSQEPAALSAVFNFQTRRHGDLFFFKMRNQFNATTSTFP